MPANFIVTYSYIVLLSIFVVVLVLVYSERLLSIKHESYNLFANILIVFFMSIIILSTLINSFGFNTTEDSSTFVRIFNTLASKNLIILFASSVYILYISNSEAYDNNFVNPIMDKIKLGPYISNRTVGMLMMFGTILITARSVHASTMTITTK